MYCPECGTEVPKDAKFCPSCGNNLADIDKEEKNNNNESHSVSRTVDNSSASSQSEQKITFEEAVYKESWDPKTTSTFHVFSDKGNYQGHFPSYDELVTARWKNKDMLVCPNCQKYDNCLRKKMDILVLIRSNDNDDFIEKKYYSYQCKHCGHHFLRLYKDKGKLRRTDNNSVIVDIYQAFNELNNRIRDLDMFIGVPENEKTYLSCEYCPSDSYSLPSHFCDECEKYVCEEHITEEEKGFISKTKTYLCPDCK